MNQKPVSKNCQKFMKKVYESYLWNDIKNLLIDWRNNQKNKIHALDVFKNIMRSFESEERTNQNMIEAFNKCLVRSAQLTKKIINQEQFDVDDEISIEEEHYVDGNCQEDNDEDDFSPKKQSFLSEKISHIQQYTEVQEIKDDNLKTKIQNHKNGSQIFKIFNLYLNCVLNIKEFKNLLFPLYQQGSQQLICKIFQAAESIDFRRKFNKSNIFAPLSDLIEKKQTFNQIGPSYIQIPKGYANFGKNWENQGIINREYVSVPLGSQSTTFIVERKNQYQQQMFKYEDIKYQIDNALLSLQKFEQYLSKYCLSDSQNLILFHKKLNNTLFQNIVNNLYQEQKLFKIFLANPSLIKTILLPRLQMKKSELKRIKQRISKKSEEVSTDNFIKGLDYRAVYFLKNQNKYNVHSRWLEQIQMRKEEIMAYYLMKQNIPQNFLRSRDQFVNTFDYLSNEEVLRTGSVSFQQFDRKVESSYPKFPDNQTLFILNFSNKDLLNDVLEIIYFYCNKKDILKLLLFKLMKIHIEKKLKKYPLILQILENKQKIINSQQKLIHSDCQGFMLNVISEKKIINSDEDFIEFMENQSQVMNIEDMQSPFEGPKFCHPFIGTKTIYLFMRQLLVIYQKFLKVKEISDYHLSKRGKNHSNQQQNQCISTYQFFLTVMMYKLKDKTKYSSQNYLRKIFSDKAYLFLTIEKSIFRIVKQIQSITSDTLSYKILKDGAKDYQLKILKWQNYRFPNMISQLTRLYTENQMLFRFQLEQQSSNIYISAWTPSCENRDLLEMKLFVKQGRKFTTGICSKNKKTQLKNRKAGKLNHQKYLRLKKQEQFLISHTLNPIPFKGEQLVLKVNQTSKQELTIKRKKEEGDQMQKAKQLRKKYEENIM